MKTSAMREWREIIDFNITVRGEDLRTFLFYSAEEMQEATPFQCTADAIHGVSQFMTRQGQFILTAQGAYAGSNVLIAVPIRRYSHLP